MEKTKSFTVKDIVITGLFIALITVCSWISVPMQIPFTLQTFAVFVTVGLLGTKRAVMAVLGYIILGGLGAPVFAGFSGGPGVLFGTTGGYILGFLLMVPVIGLIIKKLGNSFVVTALAMLAGLTVCYAFGTAWFMIIYTRTKEAIGILTAFSWCVLPYIMPDLAKRLLSVLIVKKVSAYVKL